MAREEEMDVRIVNEDRMPPAEDEEARPSRAAVEAAVRTLIRWAGDDPRREGLADTPARVARAFEEWFRGYRVLPATLLKRTFSEAGDGHEMILLRDIAFHSHCEHHLAPIVGRAHVAYLPRGRVVGISKLARVVDAFAARLQIQERLTSEIARAIDDALRPAGVAVMLEASHGCMTTRGVHKHGTVMQTKCMLGAFADDPLRRQEFLAAVQGRAQP
jgi:GTP cyclohydrolase I